MFDETIFIKDKEIVSNELEVSKFALKVLFITLILLSFFYAIYWDSKSLWQGYTLFLKHILIWIIPIIILHEGLHGLVMALSVKNGFRNVKFGFHKKYLTFYTNCKLPLKKWNFIAAGLAPFLFLGIIPVIYGLSTNKAYWMGLGIFNIFSSSADLYICKFLYMLPSNIYILDHPEKLGFFILKKQNP